MYKKHSSFSFIALLFMPRLSEHERFGAIGLLKAGVRISDVARYHNCHPSTIQCSEIVTRLLGQSKFDTGLVSQERLCIDDIDIHYIRSGRLLSVPLRLVGLQG